MPLVLRSVQRVDAASTQHPSRNQAVKVTQSTISLLNASLDIYQEAKFFLQKIENSE
jgi:hypothetical protein